jgi:hypothetical protein
MSWQNPKLDWKTNPHNPIPDDFNRIEGNIDFLKTDIETKKGAIVNALNAVGISASLTDSYAELSAKIAAAEKVGVVLTPGTTDVPIPKGIYNIGGGKVLGDPDLIAGNIKQGINIFGVAGNVVPDFLDEDWYAKTIGNTTGSGLDQYIVTQIYGKGILVSLIGYHGDSSPQIVIDGNIINYQGTNQTAGVLLLWPFHTSLELRLSYVASDFRRAICMLD